MHILIIHQIFVTPEEGGGTRHYELARYLVSKGHSVTVIASDIDYLSGKRKSNSDETRDGIRILYARTLKTVHKNFVYRAMSFLSFTVSSFIKALRVGNVDVVWGTSPPLFQSLAALTVAKLRGAPFVFEVRDLWIDFAEQLSVISNRYMIRALKIVERILYRSADKIIINSPGFEPFVAKHITGGKEICLVPN
ncbi:MAG: glycosyltransferase family 4 protein, partial [Nitrospirae bacterium]|nr:glycosyltransferase family 4 protein [Nitrospirota bacterium]